MVNDWKDCWKWLSVHAALLIILFDTAQQVLPQFAAVMSPEQFAWTNAALGVAVIVGRLIKQGGSDA